MRKPAVNIAVAAARKAAAKIQHAVRRLDAIQIVEKERYDFTTEIDKAAEAEIVRELRRAYPEHAILTEEAGWLGEAKYTWIVDPLDGTSNYLRGFPHYSVSIALAEDGVVQHGVVYDPVRDELFTASRGSGAYLDDRRLRIGGRPSLAGALIGTGLPYRQRKNLPLQLDMIAALLRDAEDLRRTGSAALDLCYVAANRLDGFFEFGLQPWDFSAGALIVQEAGGVVLDFDGGKQYAKNGNLIAGNLKVAASMVARLKPVLKPEAPKADLQKPEAET